MKKSLAAGLTAAFGLAAVHASAPLPAGDVGASSDPANWTGFGRTAGEQHYSPLDQVNEGSVARLGLAWSFDLDPGNSVSAPVAADGVLYIATGYSVVRALDAVSGKLLWTFDPKAPEAAGKKLRQGWGIRGLAYDKGRVFVGTHDGRLIALDAKTGAQVWSAQTLPKDDYSFISGAPRVFDGKVIIGFGGADVDSLRGYVSTYDAATGKLLWRFYTVPGDPAKGFEDKAQEMAAKTWAGQWWKYGGGGTVWNAMTYDPTTDSIILGTGNGAPWNRRVRSAGQGDNLFLASIVALDAKTGKCKWHYQVNPGESWDYNAAMDMELADLTIGGQVRHVLMTAPKNGFFYVIDRVTGKLISAEPYVTVSWATRLDTATGRPVEHPDIRYPDGKSFVMWPGPVGAHTWLPMAFSPKTRLVYIPAIEMATRFDDKGIDPAKWVRTPGGAVDAANNRAYTFPEAGPKNFTSTLLAWDPVAQEQVWRLPTPGMWNGGVMATAGNLVFQGRIDGTFNAYAAATGKQLWSFAAQAPVTAPPISFSVKGTQYVTVLTGMSTSGAAFGPMLPVQPDYRTQARRVLTFALGARQTLPKAEQVAFQAFDDPDYREDKAAEERGRMVYGRHCTVCHGQKMVAAGNAPDLRSSAAALDPATLTAIVRDGALVPAGMPRFEELTDAQLADLRQFIRSQAHLARHGMISAKPVANASPR